MYALLGLEKVEWSQCNKLPQLLEIRLLSYLSYVRPASKLFFITVYFFTQKSQKLKNLRPK